MRRWLVPTITAAVVAGVIVVILGVLTSWGHSLWVPFVVGGICGSIGQLWSAHRERQR